MISENAKKAVIAFETHRLERQAKKAAELAENGGGASRHNRNRRNKKAVPYTLNGLQRAMVQLGSGITAGRCADPRQPYLLSIPIPTLPYPYPYQ